VPTAESVGSLARDCLGGSLDCNRLEICAFCLSGSLYDCSLDIGALCLGGSLYDSSSGTGAFCLGCSLDEDSLENSTDGAISSSLQCIINNLATVSQYTKQC